MINVTCTIPFTIMVVRDGYGRELEFRRRYRKSEYSKQFLKDFIKEKVGLDYKLVDYYVRPCRYELDENKFIQAAENGGRVIWQ